MEIKKETTVGSSGVPTQAQLDAINAQAKGKLTQEQVYVFSLRLCDDQIDRDGERFATEALPVLAKLFIGKTGIVDHRWSAESQVARIFETQVVCEDGVSYIKAWAYIRRGGNAEEVIADIEAGIKKEVSVGCASEYGSGGHEKGNHYDGQLCCVILKEPMDAYEFSFVAVPAQRDAGVLKAMGMGKRSLKELADAYGAQTEYRELFKQAQLGRQYRKELEKEVIRLCLVLELGIEEPVLRSVMEKAGAEDLMKLKSALQERCNASLPMQRQLVTPASGENGLESSFMI